MSTIPFDNDIMSFVAKNLRLIAQRIEKGQATASDEQYLLSVAHMIDTTIYNPKRKV